MVDGVAVVNGVAVVDGVAAVKGVATARTGMTLSIERSVTAAP